MGDLRTLVAPNGIVSPTSQENPLSGNPILCRLTFRMGEIGPFDSPNGNPPPQRTNIFGKSDRPSFHGWIFHCAMRNTIGNAMI